MIGTSLNSPEVLIPLGERPFPIRRFQHKFPLLRYDTNPCNREAAKPLPDRPQPAPLSWSRGKQEFIIVASRYSFEDGICTMLLKPAQNGVLDGQSGLVYCDSHARRLRHLRQPIGKPIAEVDARRCRIIPSQQHSRSDPRLRPKVTLLCGRLICVLTKRAQPDSATADAARDVHIITGPCACTRKNTSTADRSDCRDIDDQRPG
jgi:hypothetical protein